MQFKKWLFQILLEQFVNLLLSHFRKVFAKCDLLNNSNNQNGIFGIFFFFSPSWQQILLNDNFLLFYIIFE